VKAGAVHVLIVGAGGQLGRELQRAAPPTVHCHAPPRARLDITCQDELRRAVRTHRPDWIINTAGYNAVDAAEREVEAAFAVNQDGAANVALAAEDVGARLLHISTDYVFGGETGRPWRPRDAPAPTSTYGRSKLAGENAVRGALGDRALIVRTAWLYSVYGHNFVKTMLRLMAERDTVSVVADQVGTPTWARGLAEALWTMIDRQLSGLHHWTNAGVASWYDFAAAIAEEGTACGLLPRAPVVLPIRASDYPAPAPRPVYSVLDKTETWQALGYPPPHWRASLSAMLREMPTLVPV
jgi:dTDP-4-dehydrorhamnose reductase